MNFNGGQEGLSQGGTINGNLDITGDLEVDNLTVIDTATISTLITPQELEVKDEIITPGIENPADLLNGGVLMEYESGGTKYGGMLRNPLDGDSFYFVKEMAPKPTPTDALLTTTIGKEANIVAKKYYARGASGGLYLESDRKSVV